MTAGDRETPHRILIAPDTFKGTLTAAQAAAAMAAAVRRSAWHSAQVRTVPIADGGEGTLAALAETHPTAPRRQVAVTDPLGRSTTASWLQLDGRGVLELAAASGLHHVHPTPASALAADTFGTGQLIAAATAKNSRISVALGGSATTDGGSGAMRALGAVFIDEGGNPLPPGGGFLRYLADIDLSALLPAARDCSIDLLCDVFDPLTGSRGAARRYAPQKGAGRREVAILEDGLRTLADVVRRVCGVDPSQLLGCGAAGGFAATFHGLLGARIVPGAEAISSLIALSEHVRWADLVITGEGLLDEQSLSGKAPINLAARAHAEGKPTVMAVGQVRLPAARLADYGVTAVASAATAAGSSSAAMADPARWLTAALADVIATMTSP